MCGRFSLFVPPDALASRFDATVSGSMERRYNVAPGQDVAAIRDAAPAEVDALEWGLLPGWADSSESHPRPINARAETVAEKPSFREAFAERRCLVLADGFYEWRGDRGRKRPFRIAREDGEPFAFAGLWETWGSGEETRRTTTILTTEANETVAPMHDRMPVMLEPDEEREWLASGDPDELGTLLDPYPDDPLTAYEISTRVNDPANDSPDVVEPLGHDQSGLGRFG